MTSLNPQCATGQFRFGENVPVLKQATAEYGKIAVVVSAFVSGRPFKSR